MTTCDLSAIRVLIVDDHELTRLSLSLAFQNQQDMELVGVASNGQEAIDLVRQHHPDVIVLDLQMPVMDGLSASTHIKSANPTVQILAYSSLDDPQTEVMLQTAKIDAFRKKDTTTEELIATVRQLSQRAAKM
ncbi:response regulator transcription factor [Phormidium sp. FACHB-592]|uniref:Response regulator transcription factor n=1 Tax=Stenomitos frigidus AS-A4 TaxID=2933935 RepID=A0ABV0KL33_9CYAN|nr:MULTISPECIES: response regulator transcription factor [Cyanophyceae]MBD2034954.1 response regulator transcription factor [Leptolyngbya sp. FACHB-321]MBD2073215.1 response regulator transcription factor [Phormidium sp. FACHB-592]